MLCTVSSATLIDGTAKISYTSTGFCWFGMQIFFEQAGLELDQEYKLTLNIKSDVAGQIKVNGTVVDLVVGDNAIEVYYVEGTIVNGGKAASLSIQMGSDAANTMVGAANIEISNLAWEKTEEPGPGVDPVEPSWSFKSAEMVNQAGTAIFKMNFNFAGYTRAEIEGINWCFDAQRNGGDWAVYLDTAVPVIAFESDSVFSLSYDISSLPVGSKYMFHFSTERQTNSNMAKDFKPGVDFSERYTIGDLGYKLVCTADESDSWGLINVTISDATGIEFADLSLAVEGDKLYMVLSGLYGSAYSAETLGAEFDRMFTAPAEGDNNTLSLQRLNDYVYIWGGQDTAGNKYYTVVAENGTFTLKCDISNMEMANGHTIYGHLLNNNMAVDYTPMKVEYNGFTIELGQRKSNQPDWLPKSVFHITMEGVAEPEMAFGTVSLVQEGDRILYVITGTFSGYTAAQLQTARTDLLAEYTDGTPSVDRAEGKNVVTVDEEAGTFTVVVDVTDFESTAGVKEGHLFPHFYSVGLNGNLTGTFENGQTITLGNKTFTIQEAYGMPTLKIEIAE